MDRRTFLKKAGLSGIALLPAGLGCKLRRSADRRTLLIAGSTMLHPHVKELVDAFGKTGPGIDVVLEGGGTTAGVLALTRGAIDISMMSRDLNAVEQEHLEVRTVLFAKSALSIVVHPSNPTSDLKADAVRAIFQGEIKRWDELKTGASGAIRTCSRKPGAQTRKAFEDMVLGGGDIAARGGLYSTTEELQRAVGSDPLAIGFLPLTDVVSTLKALHIGGVEMSRQTILSDRFAFTRPFFLATHRAPRAAAQEFVDFVTGRLGQSLVAERRLHEVY